ncbi:hypothetical protein F2P81_012848 [Scophthalmus maximus]|uniref:Uncharacterized protein n=1 Tax=Scophthalmus maximus TaxID=52904 RepID=A0A6A4ST66_SCOMX|nr:hypothetical protein F2P81_012848 [Scophthalmus maximus]
MGHNPTTGAFWSYQYNVGHLTILEYLLLCIKMSLRKRDMSKTKSKPQDCYANLTLKPPRPQSGRSSPQIQYSDVVQLDVAVPPESEKEDDGNTDGVSIMSDLYASVQTQQTKKVNTADTGEDYANHL